MMHWALVEALRKLEIPIAKPMCTPTATQDNTRDSPSLHKTPQPPPVAFRDSSTLITKTARQHQPDRPGSACADNITSPFRRNRECATNGTRLRID
ncbi:hypothetical protein AA0114_g920 [Alternaria tenuissima]|uniref:Uncharacterized protein n=1 Tax=Alternaria tenuissima TaxID=119927 RepID=A0A4Q4MWA0_9PLEO|nr:hypothetical protein AA0114_g920 [Alternaria tenuissima]